MKTKNFEYWMKQESKYRELEHDATRRGDFAVAARCHQLRWHCLDLAVAWIE